MDQSGDFTQSSAMMDFALARSDFLDAFADAEAAVSKILELEGGQPNPNGLFGHRLKAFREIQKPAAIAKCRISQRNQIADGLVKILLIRADIVHSRMTVAHLNGTPVAFFINSQLANDPDAPARFLTLERMRQLTTKLASYSKTIGELRKPVNSTSSSEPEREIAVS